MACCHDPGHEGFMAYGDKPALTLITTAIGVHRQVPTGMRVHSERRNNNGYTFGERGGYVISWSRPEDMGVSHRFAICLSLMLWSDSYESMPLIGRDINPFNPFGDEGLLS